MSTTTTTVAPVNQSAVLGKVHDETDLGAIYSLVLENRSGFDVDSLDSAGLIADATALLQKERDRQANFEDATRTLCFEVLTEKGGDAKALAKALLGRQQSYSPKAGTDQFRDLASAAQKLRRANGAESLFRPFISANGADALTDEVKRDLTKVANSLTGKDAIKAVAAKIEKTGKVPTPVKRAPAKKATSRSGKAVTADDRRTKALDAAKAVDEAVTALLTGDLNRDQKASLLASLKATVKKAEALALKASTTSTNA